MNSQSFKNVFSKRLGCLVAVGEHASSQGKANGASLGLSVVLYAAQLTAACVLVSMAWAGPAGSVSSLALPSGGQLAQGVATVQQAGAVMNIHQSTSKAVMNWNSFDIGTAAKVNIVQPSADAVMLNRVTSANPSQILGQLNANGQVVLVNPNGILFGKDGSVNANSFTASTLGITDANFMAGNQQFERNSSTASVVNQGSIKTSGGYVALLGASVSNEGKIETQGGTAYLAAAETVRIPVSGSGRIKLELSPSRINAAVANTKSGTIVTEGGQVYMQAAALNSAVASILQSGSIDTTGEQGGAVHLLADGGQIKVDGSITANSSGHDVHGQFRKGGDIVIGRDLETGVLAKATDVGGASLESHRGFVETSGEYLDSSGVKVKGAEWLLDPNNIEINATNVAVTAGNSVVLAGDIAAALTAGTTVTVATGTDAGSVSSTTGVTQATAGTGNTSAGTIAVNSAITSTYTGASNPTLTLSAASNIAVSAVITATGSNVFLKSTGGSISNTATISGRHVSIDNTGGSIDATTGAITKGGSTGTSGVAGISVGANITASGNLNMFGLTTNNIGIDLGAAKTLTGGNIQAVGETGSVFGLNVNSGASIVTTATSGSNSITAIGRSSGGGGAGSVALVDATLRAATGSTLELKGQAVGLAAGAPANTRGIRIDGVVDTYGAVTLTGESGSTEGVLVQAGNINVREGSLTINGTMTANGGGWRNGVTISRPINLYNNTSLTIVGKAANQGTMTSNQPEFGVGIGATIAAAAGQTAGDISITGFTSSAQNSSGAVINGNITTAGNIKIIGQTLGSSTGNSVYLNSVISSTAGNVIVQSIGGKINQDATKNISARNITIDNTGAGLSSLIADTTAGLNLSVGTSMGGSVDNTTGVVTAGNAVGTDGITLNANLTASGNINIQGTRASAGTGVNIGGTSTLTSTGVGASINAKSNYNVVHTGAITNQASGGVAAAINLSSGSGSVSGTGSIASNGVSTSGGGITIDTATAGTLSGVISGSGSLSKTGAGTTTLTVNNTYSGITTVNAGTLQVGNAGTTGSLGSGTATVAANANLTFNRYVNNNEYTIPNTIAGAGALNIVGPGIDSQGAMRLGANNSTFTGTINVSSARLWVTAANQVGAASLINVNSGGGLYAGTGVTISNPIALSGNGWQEGATSYYGALRLGDGAIISGDISLTGNARIATAGVIAANLTGVVSGSNNVEFASYFGPGTIRLTGNNTYTGTTTISSGILQVGTGGTNGTLGNGGIVTNTGTLTINRSNAITIGNLIQSTGAFTQAGTGTTTLTGANTYSGTTTISAGTLQVGSGGATGAIGSGGVVNNAALVFNRDASANLTVSGAISGTGTLTQSGAGKTILTGANSYGGTTTINTGTLQIGSGGATGTLGSGGVVNNAALIFNRDASADLTVSNVVSGTGTVTQAGAGKTILTADNSYSGATAISSGILQVGNGGATGTLGATTGVTLSGGGTVAFNKNVNTTIDKSIAGNGNVTANITGNLALTSDIALTGTNTINLTASGSITETAGSLAATNLYLTATAGSIGTTTQRIQSNVSALSLSSSGDQFVTEANGVTVSSRTTNNGNINLQTTNGTLTVGTANSVAGIVAHGSGNITLAGTSTSGIGVYVGNNVSTTTGDVSITGTSSATTSFANPEAGVKSAATISGKDITMVATVTSTSGNVLGYYGAGGGFTASGRLNLTGTTSNASNGFYSFTGAFSSGTGMSISGTSASGQAVGLDNNVTLTNGNSGGLAITGTATDSTKQAIGLRGVAMNNSGGDVLLTGVNGIVYTDAGNAAWGNGVLTNTITNGGTGAVQVVAGNGSANNSGSINGSVFTITQNGNAGVVVSTSGTGNVTSPKIINAGTGDIVVAAGSLIAAGTETGGQILTVAGNTLAQTNGTPGKTYVYSGSPSTTGVLSNLNASFNNLYYQGTSAAVNTGFNQGFDANHADDLSVPGGGTASGTQVFFRASTKPTFSLTLSNNTKAYGETDPVGWTSTNGASLTNVVAGVGGNNTFAVTTANVLAGLTGGRAAGENVGSYAYSLSTGNFNTTLTAQPNLVIGRRDITLATLAASNKVYDGSTLATITSGTFGNLFNGETLLISGQGLFGTKDVADGKTVTVADVSTLTKANGTGNWSNYNLTTTSKTTTANITKATLTVTAIDDGKIVTQADPANFLGVRVDGLKLGDAEADVIAGLNISRTNAVNDTAAGTYLGVLVPTVAASVNYDFLYVNGNYTIVPARQLLVRTTDHNVVYGSTPTFDTTATYLDAIGNPITNLTRTGTNNNYTFNDGAGTTVTMALKPYNGSSVATLSTSGNTVVGSYNVKDLAYSQTGSNFLGTPVFVGNLSVTPKAITPGASGVSKVYDATTLMTNVSVGMTGKLANDFVTISGTGAFSQPTVGSSLGYAVTGVSLSSTDAGNYFLTNGVNSFSGTDGEITRAALVATANSRTTTFNGAAQSVTGFTVAGLLGSDSEAGLVGISASGATGTNVGTYANTMTVANQTNYTVTGVNGALTIDPAPILATDISAALRGTVSKVYDGTTAATLTPANYLLTGWLGSDGATVSKTMGAYNNANVGVGKTVTVSLSNSDYQATGATNLSNYSLPSSVSGTVGVITKKDVTLTGFTASNKVYDGNSLATITASNILTGVGSETLSVRGTANFSDKNVGVSKLVSISDPSALVKVDGTGQWTNYNLLNSTATTTANITPKLLQASGLVADKVYDGTAQATLSGSAGVGVVTGDTVFLQAGSALFADKHVSRDATGQVGPKTVTVSGLALAGADAGNYVLSAGSFQAQAKITPRILDLQVSVNDKPYDGTTTATARAAASNLIAGDAVQWDLGAGFFASKDVSRNALGQPLAQRVNFDNLQMTGLDSGNYSLPFTSVRTSAFITPKVLTLLGSSVANKNVDGNTDATVTLGAVQGLVGAEQLAVSVSGRFQTATPGGNKPVDVKYSWSDGAFGGKASNYALSDDVLLGRILSPQNDAIKPILPPLKPVSGGGSLTIVAAQPAVASNLPASLPSPQADLVCTVTDLEPCDCEKTVLDGLDICLVPRNTQASRGNAGTSENGFTNRK